MCLKINLKWQQAVLLENVQYSTLETQNKKVNPHKSINTFEGRVELFSIQFFCF